MPHMTLYDCPFCDGDGISVELRSDGLNIPPDRPHLGRYLAYSAVCTECGARGPIVKCAGSASPAERVALVDEAAALWSEKRIAERDMDARASCFDHMKIDFTNELVQLMKFAGDAATAIRMYSHYSGGRAKNGGRDRDPAMTPVDLMFLSDAITQLLNIGGAIERGNSAQIFDRCRSVQKLFVAYTTEDPNFDPQPKPTFDYWVGLVDMNIAILALKGIQAKTVAAGFPGVERGIDA